MSGFADAALVRGAVLVIFRESNKVAFVLRENTSWMSGYYGLPSGKLDKGESFTAAAIREAAEEVGIELDPSDVKQKMVCYRHAEDHDWVDVFFEAINWDGKLVNNEPHMHSELAWLDMDNLPENVIPIVRWELEQLSAGKSFCEYGWPS